MIGALYFLTLSLRYHKLNDLFIHPHNQQAYLLVGYSVDEYSNPTISITTNTISKFSGDIFLMTIGVV